MALIGIINVIQIISISRSRSMSVCHFNKFGFCKFGKHCFRQHQDKLCENVRCKVLDCSLRHPRKCRFFQNFHYCKFGNYCKFQHKENNVEKDIEAIEKQLKDVKEELQKREKEIKLLDENILEIKNKLSGEIKTIREKN